MKHATNSDCQRPVYLSRRAFSSSAPFCRPTHNGPHPQLPVCWQLPTIVALGLAFNTEEDFDSDALGLPGRTVITGGGEKNLNRQQQL